MNFIIMLCSLGIIGIFIASQLSTYQDKYIICDLQQSSAKLMVHSAGPCSDIKLMHLDGEFMQCNKARKAIRMNLYLCAFSKWIDEFLPTKIGNMLADNLLITICFATVLIIALVYIFLHGWIQRENNKDQINAMRLLMPGGFKYQVNDNSYYPRQQQQQQQCYIEDRGLRRRGGQPHPRVSYVEEY